MKKAIEKLRADLRRLLRNGNPHAIEYVLLMTLLLIASSASAASIGFKVNTALQSIDMKFRLQSK